MTLLTQSDTSIPPTMQPLDPSNVEGLQIQLPRPRWAVIVSTTLLHLFPLLAFNPAYFSWEAIGGAIVLYCMTIGLGISLGFHRMAAHRSFRVPKFLEYFFILCGTLAGQGSVLGWVGYHRMHHLYTDKSKDPHDSNLGFWWSHLSWFMHEVPNEDERLRLTQDIASDPFYVFCHKYHTALQFVLGGLLYLWGGMPFVVWGIFVRLIVGFHSTFCVNSICHMFGYRSHDTQDTSTNNWWVAFLTFGEGWHNNHHAVQSSARFGWNWWEVDMVWMVIRTLETLGLATKVKTKRV